jgi:hypothetical protein
MPYSEETASYKVHYFAHLSVLAHMVLTCYCSSTTRCCGSKIPRFPSLFTQMRVSRSACRPPSLSYFRFPPFHNQIIGMDLVESEQILFALSIGLI